VIDTDAYFPNDQTSNGEAKGIEDEGKIKMMKARSNKRAPTPTLRKGELP